jgi:hypothetical protein
VQTITGSIPIIQTPDSPPLVSRDSHGTRN